MLVGPRIGGGGGGGGEKGDADDEVPNQPPLDPPFKVSADSIASLYD